jgi:hypothetical protein
MNVRPQNPCPPSMQHRRSSDGAVIRGGLTVTQAIEGFILHKNAQGLSQRTVSSYKDILDHWAARIGGETQVPSITSQDLKRYLVWKTTEYILCWLLYSSAGKRPIFTFFRPNPAIRSGVNRPE